MAAFTVQVVKEAAPELNASSSEAEPEEEKEELPKTDGEGESDFNQVADEHIVSPRARKTDTSHLDPQFTFILLLQGLV